MRIYADPDLPYNMDFNCHLKPNPQTKTFCATKAMFQPAFIDAITQATEGSGDPDPDPVSESKHFQDPFSRPETNKNSQLKKTEIFLQK